MEIAHRRVATVHFTLTGEDGETITSTRGHDPLVYMHGTGGIAAGLEEALEGRSAGDRFEVTVPPEKGFGPRHPELVQVMPPQPDWSGALWLVTHVDLHRTNKVQAFLRFLKEHAQGWCPE